MSALVRPRVMVDTCCWAAIINQKDQHREAALGLMAETEDATWVVNDYIIDETVTLVNSRQDYQQALEIYNYLTSRCRVLWLAPGELEACRRIFATYQGALSFTDAAIVYCMRREGLQYLLSFDRRFDRVEGLTRVHRPGQLAGEE